MPADSIYPSAIVSKSGLDLPLGFLRLSAEIDRLPAAEVTLITFLAGL